MKKYFGFVAFALLTVVMAMSVASCDKDKEEDGDGPGTPEQPDGPAHIEITNVGYDNNVKVYVLNLTVGDEFQIEANYVNGDGTRIDFESSEPGVASVTLKGSVKAKAGGQAEITLKVRDLTQKILVNVRSWPDAMVGKWFVYEARNKNSEEWMDVSKMKMTFEFTADGTYIFSIDGTPMITEKYHSRYNVYLAIESEDNPQTFQIDTYKDDGADLILYNGSSLDAYYRVARMPETADEAKAMMVGTWSYMYPESLYDEAYQDFNEDGNLYYIFKVRTSVSSYYWCYDYRGQTVGYLGCRNYQVVPNASDPSTGKITMQQFFNNETITYEYSCLSKNFFVGKWSSSDDAYERFVRADKEVAYKTVSQPK